MNQVTYVVEAWHALSTDRSIGMALGCIPFTSILKWAEWEHLDRDATMILVDVFQILESARIERDDAKKRLNR